MHERIDEATNDSNERLEEATTDESAKVVTTRRAVARGAAVGGLAVLFTAVGAGRVLAQDDDDQGEDNDDQGEDNDDQGEDNDDQGEAEDASAASAPMAGGCSTG